MLYFLYWGKAKPGGTGASCHLLPYHSLDVAAIGWYLLAPERPLTQHLAARLEMSPESLRRFLVFLLGLHDLGKFSRAFQGQAQPEGANLVPTLSRLAYIERHDRLGALLWETCWVRWLRDGTLGWTEITLDGKARGQLKNTQASLMAPMFGHHGKPVTGSPLTLENFFGQDEISDDVEASRQFVKDLTRIIGVDWPVEKLLSDKWHKEFQSLSWTIAGWAVLSDWLGSNQEYFEYRQEPMSLEKYWEYYAKPRAEKALRATGFDQLPLVVPYAGLHAWFDGNAVTPTPLQSQAESIELASGPQLFILEDVTGAGKTEAACILAQRLLAEGHGDGLYFALPTMATSNAMYSRLGNLHHHFFSESSHPSFVLAHGARELNDEFSKALAATHPNDSDYDKGEFTASAQCNQWLADSRKKALLAEVGVGTIDQALMGLLPFRHQSLRLYGLARKVLIVDEVHAYDIYMQTLLAQLLAYHARQGGSAILLTATLPARMRQSLAEAWKAGLGVEGGPLECQDFPLLTHVHRQSKQEIPLASRPEVSRSVAVEWLTQEGQAVEDVLAAVDAGECVAWVRNTVDDAIRAFEAIRERHPDPEHCLLFHSRFAMVDRQRIESEVLARLGKESTPDQRRGQVLISTQVFQESLDCDVDLMVSDLAPIDLLIQRAGRLQRHSRGHRRSPTLLLLAPEWSDAPDDQWLRHALPGTQAVYRDTSLCWFTQRVLRELGAIRMPEGARTLIESVYGNVSDQLPDGLLDTRWEQLGTQRMAASMAYFNALEMEKGYLLDRQKWQEEQEIGTRLTDEPTVNVVLLRVDDQGGLELWAAGKPHAAMLSQLKLRQSQAGKLTALPPSYQFQWEALQESQKALRFVQPWLADTDSTCQYSMLLGLSFNANN
ncbi:CRISPR-associated helicase Cas3' [Litchfieldella rifensis]|uniref:CRISPR-associated helicase Cas3 n=1 Tax=Litchfieldella rifensis TaxID=762643 RepID=A0ABV7LPE4_9GAMM